MFLVFMFIYQGNSQDLNVSFNGGKAVIDSITTTNLSTNESVKIIGDATLILRNSVTGINIPHAKREKLSVYYSRTENEVIMNYSTKVPQKINLQLCDINGRILTQNLFFISSGMNQFLISSEQTGIYLIKVQDEENYYHSAKIFLQDQGNNNINYLGFQEHNTSNNILKSKVENPYVLHYSLGDIISFRFYSGKNITIINEEAGTSTELKPNFYECMDGDGNNYAITEIGNQVWMAQNLAFDVGEGCWAYEGNENYVEKFGLLYNWETAMAGSGTSESNPSKVQGICPEGWHLPSNSEWKELGDTIRNQAIKQNPKDSIKYEPLGDDLRRVGIHLKATNVWEAHVDTTKGIDTNGFQALPGGYSGNGFYDAIGRMGLWWSTTESSSTYAWYMSLHYDSDRFRRVKIKKTSTLSVRCVRD